MALAISPQAFSHSAEGRTGNDSPGLPGAMLTGKRSHLLPRRERAAGPGRSPAAQEMQWQSWDCDGLTQKADKISRSERSHFDSPYRPALTPGHFGTRQGSLPGSARPVLRTCGPVGDSPTARV